MKKIILVAIIPITALTIIFIALNSIWTLKKDIAATQQIDQVEAIDNSTSITESFDNDLEAEYDLKQNKAESITDPYVIAWFSDTQGYHYYDLEEVLNCMSQYIAEKYEQLNIKYVVHTGDIVDTYNSKRQWVSAKRAFENFMYEIPMLFVAGNHDVTSKHYYELFKRNFGKIYYEDLETFGGAHKSGVGRYDLLDINGDNVIITALGYHILDSDYEWLDSVLKEHSDRTAILCFHEFMDEDGEYSNHDGKKLKSILEQNSNVKIVLCGHKHDINHLPVEFDDDGDGVNDRTVYRLLVDYQDAPYGGGGYMTFLSFDTDNDQINVTAYSPYLKDYNLLDDPSREEFSIPWEPVE